MTRRLTKGERALWERLKDTVKPLRLAMEEDLAAEEQKPPSPGSPRAKAAPKTERAPAAPAANAAKPKQPALAPFEEKTLRRLARGLVEIDARIDLHGMRQERAHTALASFLRRAQASGWRIVLVVTGKGRTGSDGRGVLRESVPHWLGTGEFRHLVVGFEEAHRRHGGAGALYIRIRRRREGARPAD